MQSYEISFLITKFGFFLAVFANSFLIYITLCHVRKIDAIYKTMVSFYAMLGILFSGWELIAKPFMHNFNESMVFFSLRTTVSQKFFQFSIAFYAGMSEALMALMAAQFVYRYLVSCRAEHSKKYEQGSGLLWILYPAIPGILYYSSFYLFCLPDHYADSYLRTEFQFSYGLDVSTVPRFVILSYNLDGSIRWKNLCFLAQAVFILGFHYLIIVLFAIKMHFQLKKKLSEYSTTYSRLQNQIFLALILQTLIPTFIFILPAGPIFFGPLLSPIFDFPIRLKSGWLCSIFSVYPAIDSIVFMVVVKEYKRSATNRVVGVFKPNVQFSAQSFTIDVRSRQVL
ncbi:Protein CBG18411 [Caenorhabditis briggsae]|uniref:Protein CBG18411 n=1 Tax=Caenorhabditis briggsae TaxID=6238 RepID=A8XT94_CAEBR|nr:Protein CBG18411 [Caenorhabditis briggsae]CAP35871.2 Protein CBG18411 [Caenorhabditis briggsae]